MMGWVWPVPVRAFVLVLVKSVRRPGGVDAYSKQRTDFSEGIMIAIMIWR
jgi:hypothetical protein